MFPPLFKGGLGGDQMLYIEGIPMNSVGQASRLPSLISIKITICQPLKIPILQSQLAEQQQRRTPDQIALRIQMQAIGAE